MAFEARHCGLFDSGDVLRGASAELRDFALTIGDSGFSDCGEDAQAEVDAFARTWTGLD